MPIAYRDSRVEFEVGGGKAPLLLLVSFKLVCAMKHCFFGVGVSLPTVTFTLQLRTFCHNGGEMHRSNSLRQNCISVFERYHFTALWPTVLE